MTSEQEQLYAALRRRLTAPPGVSAWAELGAAGVLGFRVAQVAGGLGLNVSEAEPVMAALGETGRASAFLESSVVAAGLLGRFAPQSDILRQIAEHGAICAVAGLEPDLRDTLSATDEGGHWRLHGTATLVLHAEMAAAILAVASHEGRSALFLVAPRHASALATYPTIDGRMAGDYVFDGAEATVVALDAGEAIEAALDEARACLAVEAAAIMRRLVRDTVDYANQRRQFGQALAEFQVVQHRLVDMDIQARRASAIAAQAMRTLAGPAATRARTVSAAKATAGAGGRFVGQQAVQLHGAIGMTQELPIAALFKRLTAIETELGSADFHVARHARLRGAD